MNYRNTEKNLVKLILQNGEDLHFKTRKAAIAFLNIIAGTETKLPKNFKEEEPIKKLIFKSSEDEETESGIEISDSLTRFEVRFFRKNHSAKTPAIFSGKFNFWIDTF